MTHVATLISNPARPALDDAAIALAVGVLATAQDARAPRSRHRRRHSLYAGRRGRQSDRRALAHGAAGRAVDVVVQPLAARRKRLFVADMDSTMIGQECIDELADYAA